MAFIFDKDLAYTIVCLIIENIQTIQKRTAGIHLADDFTSSESGKIVLDSVCMKLVAVGESIKNLDKVTHKELLSRYSQIKWK